MNKSDRDLRRMFNIYVIIIIIITLFNVFEVIITIIDKPRLIVLCIILNIIYLLLYYKRIYINIVLAGIMYFITWNVMSSVIIGLAGGNILSFIIDRLELLFMAVVVDTGNKLTKKK